MLIRIFIQSLVFVIIALTLVLAAVSSTRYVIDTTLKRNVSACKSFCGKTPIKIEYHKQPETCLKDQYSGLDVLCFCGDGRRERFYYNGKPC